MFAFMTRIILRDHAFHSLLLDVADGLLLADGATSIPLEGDHKKLDGLCFDRERGRESL